MRLLLASVLVLIVVVSTGCVRHSTGPVFHRPTGTCGGACAHYLACKAERGYRVSESSRRACELECAQVFSGAEPLAAFESLSCEDAIAFVEGESGRGPGTLLSDAPGAPNVPGAPGAEPAPAPAEPDTP